MKVYHIPLAVIMIWALCACTKQPTNRELLIEIPDTTESEFAIIPYLIKNKLIEELNLNRLENGVDSFELRLNTHIAIFPYGQLLVIKKIEDKWTCIEYNYLINHAPFGNGQHTLDWVRNFTIDTVQMIKKKPISGWTTFLRSIEKHNIYDLPDQEDIRAWDSLGITMADGIIYSVEFADNFHYKFYTYNSPGDFSKYFKECEDMAEIVKIFDKELGLKDSIADVLKSTTHNTKL
jgi:hypothetical protein